MKFGKILGLAFVLALLVLAPPALAEKRVALVIGNGAYKHAPALANPRNDAQAMAAALGRMKFEVVSGIDLDKPGMERLLRDFVARLDNADLALVFYAGHGLQVNGRNYFVPVEAKLERETDLAFEAVSLDLVQSVLEQTRRASILILDACRDNPLARNLARAMGTRSTGIGRGLGQTQAGIGTLIVYATQPGNVALDGDCRNSPFTAALLKHIETPGLEIRLIVSRVRQAVIESTRDKQVPWDSSSLVGEVYLSSVPLAKPPQASEPPPPTPPARQAAPSAEYETLFWQSIKDSKNVGDFKAYLERFPSGVFAPLARIRIADLERAAAADTRRADDERKKAEGERADAERKAREEAQQESGRKRNQADAVARIAGQRLDRGKAALRQNKLAEARQHAEESAALAKEAVELSPASAATQTLVRDLAAFRRDLDRRIEARTAQLLREARGFIGARKFAEAEKRIEDVEELSPAAATAARRELEAAQGRMEADAKKTAEDEARKRAEDEKRKAGETKPDPRKRAQTAGSWYVPERKRGLIAFAHGRSTLEPGAAAALERLAASLLGQNGYKITLVASADRSEGGAAELQALSRARLAAIQQWLAGKGIGGATLRVGIAPARGEGPEHRIVSVAAETEPEKKEEKAKPEAPAPGAPTAELTRRLNGAEWRGSVPTAPFALYDPPTLIGVIRMVPGGAISVVAEGEVYRGPSGGQAIPVTAKDSGSWSTTADGVCVTFGKLDGGQRRCYRATVDDRGGITLTGSGFLAGKRFAR